MSVRYAVLLTVFALGCATVKPPSPPLGQDTYVPRATLHSVQMDSSVINNMARQIAQQKKHKLYGIVVVRHGKLVFEEYYNGHTRDTPVDIRSATKSITSILTGIALDQGAIPHVDRPIMDYLRASYPDIQDKDSLSLRHLLTMQTGLDCNDQDRRTRGQEDRMYRSQDWVRYFLSVPAVSSPGQTFSYCTGGVVALGEVLAQATNSSVTDFADRFLFAPLQIENYQWAVFDNEKKVDTGGHLLITPQGLAKIGMLVLQEGRWNDQQLVSAEWIQQATQPQTYIDDNPYGFLWWISTVPYGDKQVEVIMARGNGGQVIFIVPEYQLTAVTTTGYYNSDKARIPFDLFFQAILPSVQELQPYLSKPPSSS